MRLMHNKLAFNLESFFDLGCSGIAQNTEEFAKFWTLLRLQHCDQLDVWLHGELDVHVSSLAYLCGNPLDYNL